METIMTTHVFEFYMNDASLSFEIASFDLSDLYNILGPGIPCHKASTVEFAVENFWIFLCLLKPANNIPQNSRSSLPSRCRVCSAIDNFEAQGCTFAKLLVRRMGSFQFPF